MEIEMTVGLLIPDTTALTAFHTLERMGFGQLRKLVREDYYRISIKAQDFREISAELGKVDVLVNANKNTFKTKLAGEPFEGSDEDGAITVKILVRDTDGDSGNLLGTLRDRLGFKNINSIEKGVLWTLHLEGMNFDEAEAMAREIAEKLLVNRHYQEFSLARREEGEQHGEEDNL